MTDLATELAANQHPPLDEIQQVEQHDEVVTEPPPSPGPGDNLAPMSTSPKFLRGPLRYDVDTSSPQLEAGRAFSVFVRVTNPYESPVTLLGVSASLPTEFRDKENQDAGLWATMKNQFKQELKERVVVAQNVVASNATQPDAPEPSGEIVLQHGNSSLKRFTLKTWKSTLFMPAAYIMQFQIQYKIDGVVNQDTIRQEFNIRAPLGAVLRGAFWGAITGSVLHTLYKFLYPASGTTSQQHPYLQFLGETFAGILLGGVLVVAFARKKDTQPFISIEDFYGGLFVGFSAGYVGKVLLDKVLPQ